MIPRYTTHKMAIVWSDENKFKKMLEIEILAAEAMSKLGIVPKDAIPVIKKKAKINIKRILELEETIKHDVIAFLTQISESIGIQARYLHLGMTSSDILDTTLALQMRESCDILYESLDSLSKTIANLAVKYKTTPMIGRTHGVHAEPITFGLKMASWYSEIDRAKKQLKETKDIVSYGKISGAVGTFAHIEPFVEEYVCKNLGLKPEPVSTQIIPRDRHARYLTCLSIIASGLERFAIEIRHLQRTEVLEVEEPFTKGQKGSSAMPHKRNPIMSENICGLSRIIRGNIIAALENIALWHERDISHSSAERIILPDTSIALDFMIARMNYILSGLKVFPENMLKNLEKSNDTIFSQTLLLYLVKNGLSREKAYELVQSVAFESREKSISLKRCVQQNPDIMKYLKQKDIDNCFDISSHFKNIPYIYKRIFDNKIDT